jgi:hypothetical protein
MIKKEPQHEPESDPVRQSSPPVRVKQEPVRMKQEPVRFNQEPVRVKQEPGHGSGPVHVKQEKETGPVKREASRPTIAAQPSHDGDDKIVIHIEHEGVRKTFRVRPTYSVWKVLCTACPQFGRPKPTPCVFPPHPSYILQLIRSTQRSYGL